MFPITDIHKDMDLSTIDKLDIYDIANYLIVKSDNVGDPITNKKLQKLLYYVKAWGLVYFSPEGVIAEPFEAWVHGPVCRMVYQTFKSFGYRPLIAEYGGYSTPEEFIEAFRAHFSKDPRTLDKIDLIDAVFHEYAPRTSFHLELLSHTELPWIEARRGLAPVETGNVVINEDTMREYYGAQIS